MRFYGEMKEAQSLMGKKMEPWKPAAPISKGAIAYHEAVEHAQYYIDVIDRLMADIVPKIKEGEVVVDFGAGTGVSASRFLNAVHARVSLWLVDNSPAWLGKAYDLFKGKEEISCYLLNKRNDEYSTLADAIGENVAHHVISANTVHLIPDIAGAFKGIFNSLREQGTFDFDSGNIVVDGAPDGALLIDDTVRRVHDLAIEIINTDDAFLPYRRDIDERLRRFRQQRLFVFPEPKHLDFYIKALHTSGFEFCEGHHHLFKVKYGEWMSFLKVKRLQAGILPEVGGNSPSPVEEAARDRLITLAATRLFRELESSNPLADSEGFTIQVVYVGAKKPKTLVPSKRTIPSFLDPQAI